MNNNYIKDVVFQNKEELYESLVDLNNKIKSIKKFNKPYIIEFAGTARSGKSTSIELIADVFRKNGFNVIVVDEEAVKLTKSINENRSQKMKINSLDYTNNIIKEKVMLYDEFSNKDADIVIFDRGINDEFIWLDTFGADNASLNEYDKKISNRCVDMLIILTCNPEVSMKRKYLNSLSIMPNKWTNIETCTSYLNSIEVVKKYFKNHAKRIEQMDSSNCDKITVALKLCNRIIEEV